MRRPCLALAMLLFAVPALAQPGNPPYTPYEPVKPQAPAARAPSPVEPGVAESIVKAHDKNGDHRLNADECPAPFRPAFGKIDTNHDGYLDEGELALGLGIATDKPRKRGKVIANYVMTVADDFIVEVYHNGEKVPDTRRSMLEEVYGATVEKIDVEVREGDWLVFNVVNNRLRWGGVSYFAAAGMKSGTGVTFVSDTASERWSYCDDPGQVAAFLSDPGYLARQAVRPIDLKWDQGDSRMSGLAAGWKGSAIWGTSRNTWLKYVAPAPADAKP
jgi:hypothetical protein